jgi:threonine dehydratase
MVGTIALEILEELPQIEAVFAPLGGGGLMAGLAATIKHLRPDIRVIGVEPEVAADAQESFKAQRLVSLPAEQMGRTLADGLRVQQLGRLNWPLVRDHVDEIVTVSEAAIVRAMGQIARDARLVAEPSGAVAAAGALASGLPLDRTVAILSGGNVDFDGFASLG